MTQTLASTLREELALNPHNDDEGHLRCTCDECIAALVADSGVRKIDAARIRETFKALDEAAANLPIPREWLDSPAVQAFSLAKHHVHVLLNDIATGTGQ